MPEPQENGLQELSEILAIRREKLNRLEEEGNDPFLLTSYDRTDWSAQIREQFDRYDGQPVRVAGQGD